MTLSLWWLKGLSHHDAESSHHLLAWVFKALWVAHVCLGREDKVNQHRGVQLSDVHSAEK